MEEQRTSPGRRRILPRVLAVAAIALLLIGGGLYLVIGLADNEQLAATGSCTTDDELMAAIEDARGGEVAAVLPAESENLSELSFIGPMGETLTLADFSGQTVLLNLWATWCVPCREEMPALDNLQMARGSDDFQVVAVNIDNGGLDKAETFLAETGVDALPLFHDQSMDIFNEMKRRALALGLPATVIVDRNSCLVAKLNGPAQWDAPEALELIDTILTRTTPAGSADPASVEG